MPELEEVFRVATQKVRRDPGALDRQVEKQRRAVRNRKVAALAVVAVITIAVAGAAIALSRNDTNGVPASPSPQGSVAPVVFPTGTVTSSMVNLDTGVVTPLPQSIAFAAGDAYAVSPDHTEVAFDAYSSPHALYVANVDGTNVHQVSPDGVDTYGAQWSPDGTKLVYQQRDASTKQLGNLFVLDVATGTETQITNLDQSQPWGWWFLDPSFEPDGQHVLYQLPSGDHQNAVWDLWSVALAGGDSSVVLRNAGWGAMRGTGVQNVAYVTPVSPSTFHGANLMIGSAERSGETSRRLAQGSIVAPQWSPDGTRIAYQQGNWIDVVNVTTGEVLRVVKGSNPEWFDDHTLVVGG